MKTISITIVQEGFSYELNYKGQFRSDKTELDKMKGSALKALFDLVKLRQTVKFKGLKLNQPIDLIIETEGKKLSTMTIDERLKTRLKVGNSFKAKQRYANVFIALIDYMVEEKVAVTVEEVIASIQE